MTLEQLLYTPTLWVKFKKHLFEFAPDFVIHTNFHHLSLLFPVLSSKSIHLYHSHEVIKKTPFYQRMFNAFSKKIATFIGVSQFVSSSMKRLGIPGDKVCTIYNGVDFEEPKFLPITRRDNIHIGIIGQIASWKGHEDLIYAVKQISKEYDNIRCLIYGNGTLEFINHLKNLISELSIDDIIFWKGFEIDQTKIYSNLDIVCAPSRFEEPFGLVAVEPSFWKVPVVATATGGLKEIVLNGETGVLVEKSNPESLAKGLKELLDDESYRKMLGEKALERVKTNFSLDKMISDFERLCLKFKL